MKSVIYVGDKSEAVQKALFSVGYTWPRGDATVETTYFLFLHTNSIGMSIPCGA